MPDAPLGYATAYHPDVRKNQHQTESSSAVEIPSSK